MTEVFSWLVHMFGMMNVTMWAISFFSTIPERVLLFFLCAIALGASFFFTRFFRSSLLQFLLPVLTSFALFFGLYTAFPFYEYPFPVDGYLFPGDHPVAVALSLTLIVAIDRWRVWLRGDNEEGKKTGGRGTGWLPTVVTAALAVVLLNGWSLRGLGRGLHADRTVQQFAVGDFNGLEFDAEQGLLFASGHGTNYLLAYNADALDQAPRRSQVEIGGAQAFAYNPPDRELCVLNLQTKTLLFLDATTLALERAIPGVEVTPGDIFMTWDRHTDQLLIASEEPEEGYPTIVVDWTTGRLLYTMESTAFNIYLHPHKPLVYMSLDEEEELVAYDAVLRKFTARFDARNRFLERMVMTPDQGELLVAAPVNWAVFRFDPETLEFRGRIDTVVGVRTLAVDPVRNLLLTGSLISNMLEVIDLKTKARVAKYYVGPWLRTIALDTRAGIAYVSSIEGLFRVDYAAPGSKS